MENYIDISNQYGKLSSLYSVRNLLQAEINREEEKLKEKQEMITNIFSFKEFKVKKHRNTHNNISKSEDISSNIVYSVNTLHQ